MRYNVPYFTYEFNNTVIDENLFKYLKFNSKEKILSDFEEFTLKTKKEFNEEWKTQKLVYEISITVFAIVLAAIVYQFATDFESKSEILGYVIVMFFPSFFGLCYAYSYGLSAAELRRALRSRKKNLLKAQKIANTTASLDEFVRGIRV